MPVFGYGQVPLYWHWGPRSRLTDSRMREYYALRNILVPAALGHKLPTREDVDSAVQIYSVDGERFKREDLQRSKDLHQSAMRAWVKVNPPQVYARADNSMDTSPSPSPSPCPSPLAEDAADAEGWDRSTSASVMLSPHRTSTPVPLESNLESNHVVVSGSRQRPGERPTEYFARMEGALERRKETETPAERQSRLARVQNAEKFSTPPSGVKVYSWIEDENGVLTRTPIQSKWILDAWDDAPDEHKRYDALNNEWDIWEGLAPEIHDSRYADWEVAPTDYGPAWEANDSSTFPQNQPVDDKRPFDDYFGASGTIEPHKLVRGIQQSIQPSQPVENDVGYIEGFKDFTVEQRLRWRFVPPRFLAILTLTTLIPSGLAFRMQTNCLLYGRLFRRKTSAPSYYRF